MDALKEFLIPFKSLKEGHHLFDHRIKKSFFDAFDFDRILDADIACTIDLEKKSSVMTVEVSFKGQVETSCDRCNEPCHTEVEGVHKFYFKFGSDHDNTDEDIYFVGLQDNEIDVSLPLYEYLVLSLPARKVHEEGDCDPDVIDALYGIEEDNDDNDDTNPLWDALKKLK